MNCETCGRPAENGTPTHWLGCEVARPIPSSGKTELTSTPNDGDVVADEFAKYCELDTCAQPKWSDGPRTKYCETHKDPKNREK